MGYKILISYVLSAIAIGAFVVIALFLMEHFGGQVTVSNDLNPWVRYALCWIFIGLTNGIVTNMLKSLTNAVIPELIVCLLTCALILSVYASRIQVSFEGLSILAAGFGLIIGLLVFFVKKIILRLINAPKFRNN